METRVRWKDLDPEQKEMAINNYAAIRSEEEECPCDMNRAREMAPYCRAFYVSDDGSVSCDI